MYVELDLLKRKIADHRFRVEIWVWFRARIRIKVTSSDTADSLVDPIFVAREGHANH